MKLGFILNSRQTYSYFTYLHYIFLLYVSIVTVGPRETVRRHRGWEIIRVLGSSCLEMMIGNQRSTLFIGSCSLDVLIESGIGTVKHKTILQLFNTYYPICFCFNKVPSSEIITIVI